MRALAASALAVALAVGVAACGGDDEEESGAPATAAVTPADAPLFGNAVVRPEGDQADAADEALSKLLNTDDPGAFIAEQIDAPLQDDAGITYSEDVEPWLGEHVGLFVTSFAEEPDGAFIAEVTDQSAAADAIEKVEETQGPSTDRTYKGIEYRVEDAGSAVGFVEDFLVAGSEAGFRDAVDASEGDSLGDDDAFQGALETAPDDALVNLYADAPTVLDRVVEAGDLDEPTRATLEAQIGPAAEGTALASVSAASDYLALETQTAAADTPEPEESPLLREFPADSWFAFGFANYGEYVVRSLGQAGDGAAGELLDSELEAMLGVDLDELTGWIGDTAGYASGASIFGLGGALVLETTDETESANALGAIGRSLGSDPSVQVEPLGGDEPGFTVGISDAPVQITVEQREGRVVAGLGDQSVEDVFEPTDTLGESDAFGAASETLGDDYAAQFFLDFEPVLELFESTGAADDDPDYVEAKPYLDHLDHLIVGQRRADESDVFRVVLGLR
ncbi:MAG: DUF3352 domain-containing protein [Solirubrobacterales bacterium]